MRCLRCLVLLLSCVQLTSVNAMWPTVSDTANCKNRCNNGGNKHIVVWLHWAGSWEAAAFFKDWIRSTHGMIWFTRHKPAWLNSGVQQHTRGSGVKWAKQEIREIVGWKCHWQGWSRSSSCTDSIKKKNVVQNMMLMWSQLDAQLRMNLWKSWISSPATLSKVRSTTDVVSADVDFWSSPFLWLDT